VLVGCESLACSWVVRVRRSLSLREFGVLTVRKSSACSQFVKVWRARGCESLARSHFARAWCAREVSVVVGRESLAWSQFARVWCGHSPREFGVVAVCESLTCSWVVRV